MREQFYSGYMLSSVRNCLPEKIDSIDTKQLLTKLCTYEVDHNLPNPKENDPIIAVYENIISRGQPTLPSYWVEKTFSDEFLIAHETGTQDIINFRPTSLLEAMKEQIFQALFLIDPRIKSAGERLSRSFVNNEHPMSGLESRFLFSFIPEKTGLHVQQLIETQREISSVGGESSTIGSGGFKPADNVYQFVNQRLDFTIELPHAKDYISCIALETDGSQHSDAKQQRLDKERDDFLVKQGWAKTIRFSSVDLDDCPKEKQVTLHSFLKHPYVTKIQENYYQPLWDQQNGVESLQIALAPFAISRIQKILLRAIRSGVLNLSIETWDIAVLERDVPCAYTAMVDFQETLKQLFVLEGKGRTLPRIKLKVYRTKEFDSCILNSGVETAQIEDFPTSDQFDLVIDISMLQRFGYSYPQTSVNNAKENVIAVRSAYSINGNPRVSCARPIKYDIDSNEQEESLHYFLRNLFRKKKFRDRQIEIIRLALNMQSVIALLPTGAGKSLTYQLSTLLQPGISIVIDPLKSLMRDQVKSLRNLGIDSSTYINSSLTAIEKETRSIDMTQGCYQFVFVSPERLQIPGFRSFLKDMNENTCFVYCVVDEAHCVSEWGHDFRTAYLKLGENARKYCKTFNWESKIPLIGLTGTASYDVLADVQRELFIEKNSHAVITPKKYERKELNFEIIKADKVFFEKNVSDSSIRKSIAQSKTKSLLGIISNLPYRDWNHGFTEHSIDLFFSVSENSNSGIIFCPHKGNIFGVDSVKNGIVRRFPYLEKITGTFAGSSDDDVRDVSLEETQDRFISDDLRILVATKAFGMGIDKPNVRFTIHFSMPPSIESFYQEAGRAGRDGHTSYCYLIHSSTIIESIENEDITLDKQQMLTFHKKSFPGPEKETTILWELLDNLRLIKGSQWKNRSIALPTLQNAVLLNLWEDKRMYVNDCARKTYGYIDFRNSKEIIETDPKKIAAEEDVCKQVLQSVHAHLQGLCPEGKKLKGWLTEERAPGIEQIISNLDDGETFLLVVPFENSIIREIVEYLGALGYSIKESDIRDAIFYCFSSEEFIAKISSKSDFSEEIRKKLSWFFMRIRREEETHRAVYRLSIIGVVEDYEVDYNSDTVMLTIVKHNDQYYIDRVKEYVSRYDTPEYVKLVESEILSRNGRSTIQKCCGYLTAFVYDKIASKRLEAINVMEEAINSTNFEDYVNVYFDSKYTVEFRKHLDEDEIDWIWEFLTKEAKSQDAISHIRGGCNRLLVERPNMSSFRLLRAFANFGDPQYDKQQAIRDLREGWDVHQRKFHLSRIDYMYFLSQFFEALSNYDEDAGEHLLPEFLDYHLDWIESFTNIPQEAFE